MTDKDAELDALYAELPTIECQGFCWDACTQIDMTDAERDRVERAGGDIPPYQAGGAIKYGPTPCPALDSFHRCTVYEARPLVCRAYGTTKRLPCAYGCRPSRWMTQEEWFEFMARAHEISGDAKGAALIRKGAGPEWAGRRELIHDLLNAGIISGEGKVRRR